MTTETPRNLAREVAIALGWRFEITPRNSDVTWYKINQPNGQLVYRDYSHIEGYMWPEWEVNLGDMYPDYPNDLNACARDLTREGYRAVLRQTVDGWEAYFVPVYTEWQLTLYGIRIDITEKWDVNPAVAWCESFLALCKHVDGKTGEGR